MIISPWSRLGLLVFAAVIPVWVKFFTLEADYTLRGLAIAILESLNMGILIIIARTRNPLVDGEDQAKPIDVKAEIVPPKPPLPGNPTLPEQKK